MKLKRSGLALKMALCYSPREKVYVYEGRNVLKAITEAILWVRRNKFKLKLKAFISCFCGVVT